MAVLNVDSALFSDPQSQQYDLNIDPGVDLMIVNVVGTTVNFTQGNFTGVFSDPVIWPHLIWNFVDADSISLQRAWFGSIIAPHANLTSSTSIDGSVFIGGDFDQRGEVHLPLFRGKRPTITCPGASDRWTNLNEFAGDRSLEAKIRKAKPDLKRKTAVRTNTGCRWSRRDRHLIAVVLAAPLAGRVPATPPINGVASTRTVLHREHLHGLATTTNLQELDA